MKAIAVKQSSNDATRKHKVKEQTPGTAGASVFSSPDIAILRMPTCPCGGGCPRCRGVIQPKLMINQPGDIYEQEADKIAEQVMATSVHPIASSSRPRIQRLAGPLEEQADSAPASVDQVLASPGRPLEPALRQDMEQRFGHDFSKVRVHSDADAGQSAREVNATAYTVGHDIVFGAGMFAMGTQERRRLLAHELTHVVQQSSADGNSVGQNNENCGESAISQPVAEGRAVARSVQRAPAPPAEIEMPADPTAFFNRMLSHPNYIDNNMKKVEFFGAVARIHYKDGSSLELGLVPKWMKPPFVEVDYHTPREDYRLRHDPKGNISFIRESELQNVPRSMPWAEVQMLYARPVSFFAEGKSGRIVPSRVNMLTAPNLCKILLNSEMELAEQIQFYAEMGLGIAEVLQVQAMNPLMGGMGAWKAATGRAGGGPAAKVGAGAAAKELGGAAAKEGLTFVEIGAGDLKAAIELAKRGGVKVIAIDTAAPAAAAVKELQGLGGQFVKGGAADLAPGIADHVFQYFPWKITGTGRWAGGGTFRLVEDTARLLKPNGAAHFVTEDFATAQFLAKEASQRGLKAVITETTAGAAAHGATGAGVPAFSKALKVWMVNIYK